MGTIKKILVLLVFFTILTVFTGVVSAASLNVTDAELAATGVKNYTAAHGHVPGYVDVSDKNSTAASFLNTITSYTVELNSGSTTPVTISSVGVAPSPSGSATGTLQKSEYVTVANNVKSYIKTNGRAPNYASSRLGNIRYESLIYMYSRILDYYRTNNQLPSSITVTSIAGVDSTGVTIDNMPPNVTNNLASGTYNTTKSVTLTANDDFDTNPTIYYSINNGTSWNNHAKTLTLNLNQGVTNLKYYGRDASGNIGTTQTATYTLDFTAPTITANPVGGIYNTTQTVTLTATDNFDPNPTIYYTLNGTTPTISSTKYTCPIIINKPVSTILEFIAVDAAGNQGPIQIQNYTLNLISNINTTKNYSTIQNAINDPLTSNGDIIELQSGTYTENIFINKKITLRPINGENVTIQAANPSNNVITINSNGIGSIIEGLTITGATGANSCGIYLDSVNNCNITDNVLINNGNGAKINNSNYTFISGNTVTNNTGNGIEFESSDNNTILANTVKNNLSEGISLDHSDYNLISENNVMNNSGDGIYIGYSNSNLISGNAITNNGGNGIYLDTSTYNKVWNSTITNNSHGIYLDLSYGSELTGNVITNNHNNGIYLESSNNAKITQNTLKNNSGSGINFDGSSGNFNFNVLSGNGAYGLYGFFEHYDTDSVNATNNWWGTNSPIVSSNTGSDIYIVAGNFTYNPWLSADMGFDLNFTQDDIDNAANTVKTYIETHHALPSSITISGEQVTIPQFLKLATTSLLNIKGNYAFLLNYGVASTPSENMTSGIINATEFMNIASNVNSFMDSNGKAPNYVTSSEGNIRYESLVYIYSEILSSYNINGVLPYDITVDPWSVISNTNTLFYSIDQVTNASSTVKAYVESHHALPSSVTISGTQVSMASFLELEAVTIQNIEYNFDASSVFQSYGVASSPSETITSRNMGETEYINVAIVVRTFMDDPNYKKAPNYATTSFGNMRFESLVYTYSQLLDYYNSTGYLPENVTVNPWSVVSNSGTVFFTVDQINSAAKIVKNYIESNHALPNNVTISGSQLSMPQFLQLSTEELLNFEGNLCTSFVPRTYVTAPSPSENATNGNINSTEYLNIANSVNSFMDSNGKAPNCITSSLGNIRYESLVYMFSQILNSYNSTNGTLPGYITINTWSIVSNASTVFLDMNQINNASETVKSYVETNYILPGTVTISGVQVNMPQYLELATTTLLNIEGNLNTSIVLGNIDKCYMSTENIVSGDIKNDEYTSIAKYIKGYIDVNGTAPDAYQTSLGTYMGCPSLIYMYSQILNSYNANNGTLPDYITVTPWIAVSNPNAIYNYQTNKVFTSIQAAIDDNDTVNGETIGIGISNVSENIVVNKTLTIMSVPNVDVTVQAADPNLPVFTITTTGSGSYIQDLTLQGATNNAGIYINNSFYNTISDVVIMGNGNGIYIDNSTDNQIADSSILNNTLNGVFINSDSDNNTIEGNILTNNGMDGISIDSADDNKISSNVISSSGVDGIYLNNSSTTVNFNQITGNVAYGIYNVGNGTVNAENNWWGSNNPNVSLNSSSDIGINGGTVNCEQWLVLNVTSSCDRSNINSTTYNYIITADLTHNNLGKDTSKGNGPSSGDTIPDEIPINFNTTFGTIDNSVVTRNGKSVTVLNSSSAGIVNVSATLDNQTITIPINVTSVNVLGVYNNRTGEGFSTIQAAIDSNDTLDGDTIILADGTYTENVVVYKRLTIKPVDGANVTVQAEDPGNAVFAIIHDGSNIENLNLTGAANSCGIFDYASNINLTGNTIFDNNYGVILFNSNNTIMSGNTIMNNLYGNVLYNSSSTQIFGSTITNNWYGNMLLNSTGTQIFGSTITNNWYGVFAFTSNSTTISENNITNNDLGMYLSTSDTTISANLITNNSSGISYYESTLTSNGNDITNNEISDMSLINIDGVVVQDNIWNCGPASLATVMNNMGVNATQDDLADISGTDKSGTMMSGLVQAAQAKGLNATGMILSWDALGPNNIILLTIGGIYHFSVIKSINGTTVSLADSAFGNVNMTLNDFIAVYTGYVLIITNNSINNTVNGTLLTKETMQTLKGTSVVISGPKFRFPSITLPSRGSILGKLKFAGRFAGPVGFAVSFFASIEPVGGKNEMYYFNKAWKAKKSTVSHYRSSPHGHTPAKRYIVPKYTKSKPYYNRTPSKNKNGYVSPSKGYVPSSTVNQVDVEYQQYLDKKFSEINKIYNTEIRSERNPDVEKGLYKLKNGRSIVPGPPKGDESTFVINLYKLSKKVINSGINDLRMGNYVKGTTKIGLGTGGIQITIAYLIDNFWPEGLGPKTE